VRRSTIFGFVAPLILGFVAAAFFEFGILANQVLVAHLACDLTWLALSIGILVGVVVSSVSSAVQLHSHRLTQVRRDEQAAQAANWQRFLRRLDHELKNPLTIIFLGITNLQDRVDSIPNQKTSLDRMGQQVKRLQKLVVDLRRLTELEECDLELTRLNLCGILQEAVDACSAEDRTQRIELHFQKVPWPVGAVSGDRDLLVVALRNLLDNALKFTKGTDRVEVRAADDGRTVTIEVADNGMGIPADELDHIFEELYRGKNARGIPGSGLGLSLARKVVLLHGGMIDVRSREGQGTVVTVRLPLASDV
jgi:two-component system OmpR family sensor kinase